MSYADILFKESCVDILTNGTDTQDQVVRPHWPDGEPAYTIKKFGLIHEYDLRKEFPALTIRPVPLKLCMDEILWIYQKKSNNIKDLKPHIWDEWADENGSIGTVYGYSVGTKTNVNGIMMDQMDRVLYLLKNSPYSRRIMIDLYQFKDLETGHLDPCCFNFIFNVTKESNPENKLVLNGILNQRSQDMLAANGWNVCQYAIFLMMVAQVCDMIPGKLIHVIADAHIYDRHELIVRKLLSREEFPAPKVSLNKDVKDFYQFTTDDLIIENYQHGEQIKNIPIAI